MLHQLAECMVYGLLTISQHTWPSSEDAATTMSWILWPGLSMASCLHSVVHAILNGSRVRTTGQMASADRENTTRGSNDMTFVSSTPTPCSCFSSCPTTSSLRSFSSFECFGYVSALDGVLPQGECQMSDDTSDVGRIFKPKHFSTDSTDLNRFASTYVDRDSSNIFNHLR